MIVIKKNISIYPKDLIIKAARSSGPGGQHVNKVSSKITLMCPLDKINGLKEKDKEKIRNKIPRFIHNNFIVITSQKYRSQYSNRQDALERLISVLQKALKSEKKRKKTHIPKAAIEKRLFLKNKRSRLKKSRNRDIAKDME